MELRTSLRARAHPARHGFSLLEVVLAMGILLLGMSVIIGLFSFGAGLSRTAQLRSGAADAIEAVVADLEETLFPLLPDGSVGEPREIVDRPLPGRPGLVYSAVASPNPLGPALLGGGLEYRVDIDISWSSAGARRSRRFTTLMLREIPFGERLRRELVEPGNAPAQDE